MSCEGSTHQNSAQLNKHTILYNFHNQLTTGNVHYGNRVQNPIKRLNQIMNFG